MKLNLVYTGILFLCLSACASQGPVEDAQGDMVSPSDTVVPGDTTLGDSGAPADTQGADTSSFQDTLVSQDSAASDSSPLPDTAPQDVPFTPEPFIYAQGCQFPADPGGSGDLQIVDAFPNLPGGAINYPLGLTHSGDGSKRLFVNERYGRIRVFQNDPQSSEVSTFLDLSSGLYTGGEGGLLGLAFHPDYKTNRRFFVNYTISENGTIYTIVSGFTASAANPDQADPASEWVVLKIAQPYSNHNGGMVAFGPDGYLYVGMGDGGSGGDPKGNGQNLSTLHGNILRIDVDKAEGGNNYAIPPDNPFVLPLGGERPEIYAWGIRNAWRFSFDTVTGYLWLGDVGQKAWEEIDIVVKGGNYGWNIMEGFDCYPPQVTNCDKEGLVLPVAVYPTSGKGSVTGGYVYRGSKVPALYGTYLWADYEQKTLYRYRYGEEDPPDAPTMVTPTRIAAFGQDAAGEVYLLGLLNGKIYTLAEAGQPPPAQPLPQTLSETGCFGDTKSLDPVPGVLPYDVNHPFWADGARKSRYVVLPQGGQISYDADGRWDFPVGTLFIKHFFIDGVEGDSTTEIRLETRFLIVEENAVRGYVYRWNDDGTEAHLLTSGETRSLQIKSQGAEEPVSFDWRFPARHQCQSCHTEEAGGVLGLETRQLNRVNAYEGVWVNQIDALEAYGLFTQPLGEALAKAKTVAYPAPSDTLALIGERARAYLHVNCSSCHMGLAGGGTALDLRYQTAMADMKACNVKPEKGTMGVVDPAILVPSDALSSILYLRIVETGIYRMPPIASALPDATGAKLISDWIASLPPCPEP
jgi:uncharacterized repeat protein (TIGR03806 family)